MMKRYLKQIIIAALSLSLAAFAYAEDAAAPVYDADNYPPAFDNAGDASSSNAASAVTTEGVPPPVAYNQAAPSSSTEQRLTRAEQQISNMQNKDLSSKVDTLRNEIQSLRGQVEQLNHQLQQMQNQQRTQYSDLDKRVNSLKTVKSQKAVANAAAMNTDDTIQPTAPGENTVATDQPLPVTTTSPVLPAKAKVNVKNQQIAESKNKKVSNAAATTSSKPTSVAPAPTASTNTANDQQPNVAEEQQIYQTAYDLIKTKKYNEAISALQKMLQKYPSGQFAANAHYWLGELYGLLGKNNQAAVEFSAVVENYPDSPKVSDAQLKLGLIYAAQFNWSDAKSAFKKVINHYPGTASARLASEQLKQIREAGH